MFVCRATISQAMRVFHLGAFRETPRFLVASVVGKLRQMIPDCVVLETFSLTIRDDGEADAVFLEFDEIAGVIHFVILRGQAVATRENQTD